MAFWKSTRSRWYHAWAAPLLLLAIALGQQILAHTQHLTPWKGGGFGMFSTVDHPGNRTLRVYVGRGGEEVRVPVPEGTRAHALARRAKPFPTPARLRPIAEEVVAWRSLAAAQLRQLQASAPDSIASAGGAAPEAVEGGPAAVPPEWLEGPLQVRVEVWGMTFDRRSRTIRGRLLNAYVHHAS